MTDRTCGSSSAAATQAGQLWLELAPHAGGKAQRLLVFLHGAGTTPETYVPLALAWQLKFPAAAAVILQGLVPGHTGAGRDWFDPRGTGFDQRDAAIAAAHEVGRRIVQAAGKWRLDSARTAVIGFSQGATLALELARLASPPMSIVIAHAARLLRPLPADAPIQPQVHLLHGELDSVVPAQQSVRAFRALRDAGARVSLDIVADGIHSVGQDMVNIGTARMLQTLFRHRKAIELGQYGASLTLSTDSRLATLPAGQEPADNDNLH